MATVSLALGFQLFPEVIHNGDPVHDIIPKRLLSRSPGAPPRREDAGRSLGASNCPVYLGAIVVTMVSCEQEGNAFPLLTWRGGSNVMQNILLPP
jgi:hypothetical protein